MNIGIIGFGNIGKRHFQSLLSQDFTIYILEPDIKSFESGIRNFDLGDLCVKHCSKIEELNGLQFELIIHATNADVRYDSLVYLIQHTTVKHWLIEKVSFQSLEHFDSIVNKIPNNSFVHLPIRYYSALDKLSYHLPNDYRVLNCQIKGSEWGVLCNLIHYLDLLKIIDSNFNLARLVINNIDAGLINSKRGAKFQEIVGELVLSLGDIDLRLIDRPDETFEISINDGDIVINNEGIIYNKICIKGFREYTSKLTLDIVKSILSNNCDLPILSETRIYHSILFDIYNNIASTRNISVPIT